MCLEGTHAVCEAVEGGCSAHPLVQRAADSSAVELLVNGQSRWVERSYCGSFVSGETELLCRKSES